MREIRREALVPFSAPDMFDLIERVEDYPQFLPWCMAAQLLERTEVTVSATVEVGVHNLRVRVTTRNDKRPPEYMAIHLDGGSFRHFHGEWLLRPLGPGGCHVTFFLRYELALRAEAIAGHWIDHAADRMVDAFVQRAESLLVTPAVTSATTIGPADPST